MTQNHRLRGSSPLCGTNFMAKKVTKSKKATVEEVLNAGGEYLPDDVAQIFHLYYESFLKRGFNCEQAFKLTQQVAAFYLS